MVYDESRTDPEFAEATRVQGRKPQRWLYACDKCGCRGTVPGRCDDCERSYGPKKD
jgi:hypothetical protein